MKYANPFFKILRTAAMAAAVVMGLAVVLGVAWLGSNLFDERLTPATKALLAPRHDPFAPGKNIFVALAGFNAPNSLKSRPWAASSIWQTAKAHRARIAALIAANQELYRRYLGLHELRGYFDSDPPGSHSTRLLVPHEIQELFLAETADELQTGTSAQQEAALAGLRKDIRMWKAVLDGHGGLASKVMAAISLHADFLLLGDMVTDPDFHPAPPGDGMESLVAPFPLQDWKIGGAYGWEMRDSAPLLEAIARPDTRPRGSDESAVGWWRGANSRISAQFFKLNATENLEADRLQRLCALADGDPGSFIERRAAYRGWKSREFPARTSWYNPMGRALLAIAASAPDDDYPARVFDIAAFQRLVFLAYQIRRGGIGLEHISAFMKAHPEWSTHPVAARPFHWNAANSTLGVQPIGGSEPIAHSGVDARHHLDVANAILESHEIRASPAKTLERNIIDGRVGPAVVDDPQASRPANRLDVRRDTLAIALREIGRHQQQPVGARRLRNLRQLLRHLGSITAWREQRQPAVDHVHRDRHDLGHLRGGKREELSGATRCEQPGGSVTARPVDVVPIRLGVERAISPERRHGKR